MVILAIMISITVVLNLIWHYFLDPPPKQGKRLPGPISIPFLGSALQIALSTKTRNYEIFEEIADKYGPVTGLRVGCTYAVIVSDFELGKAIMNSDDWSARAPPFQFMFERSFNKNLGLIWSHGESWKEARRYTTRTLRQFGFGKTKTMESFIHEEIQYFFSMLNKRLDEEGSIISMKNIFTFSVLNLTWTMMAGIRISYEDPRFKEILSLVDEMFFAIKPGASALHAFPFLRFIPGLTEHDVTIDVHLKLQAIFQEIIAERREQKTYKTNPVDFIDAFLRDVEDPDNKNVHMTEEQLIMVCIDLFFTSSDTTSAALEFALLYMVLNPEVIQKVKAEITGVLGDRMPRLEDRARMPYIEATTMEILRYSSINPVGGRSPNIDCIINEYFIPKDSIVAILMHKHHFSKEVWGDPVAFRPERFLGPKNEIINDELITPFGYGKRICIGESLARASFFLFFTMIMQRYDLKPSTNPMHKYTVEPRCGITNTPAPYYLEINPISSVSDP